MGGFKDMDSPENTTVIKEGGKINGKGEILQNRAVIITTILNGITKIKSEMTVTTLNKDVDSIGLFKTKPISH